MKKAAWLALFAFLGAVGIGAALPPAPGSHGWCVDECTAPYLFIQRNLYDICRLGGGGVAELLGPGVGGGGRLGRGVLLWLHGDRGLRLESLVLGG